MNAPYLVGVGSDDRSWACGAGGGENDREPRAPAAHARRGGQDR